MARITGNKVREAAGNLVHRLIEAGIIAADEGLHVYQDGNNYWHAELVDSEGGKGGDVRGFMPPHLGRTSEAHAVLSAMSTVLYSATPGQIRYRAERKGRHEGMDAVRKYAR